MNFNFDLFIDILWLGTLSGIISTICLQKIKNTRLIVNHRLLYVIIHFFIGYSISRLFTNLPIKLCIATGVITWIGAETIYEKLSSKNLLSSNFPVDNINDNKNDFDEKENLDEDNFENQESHKNNDSN